jgi:small-conductance mechanosensitive channel
MVSMTALYVAGRFGVQVGEARIEYRSHMPDLPIARLIADVSVLLLLIALTRLTQMLGRIAAGELFSAAVIGRFRGFAFWLLSMALLGLVAPAIIGLFASTSDPTALHLAIRYSEVITVGVTLVLFLLARLLERARGLDEEVREFI